MLDDGQPHPPLAVLGQVHDGGEKGLREELHPYDLVQGLQLGDDVETDVRGGVAEKLEEEGEEVRDGVLFPQERSQVVDSGGQGRAYVLAAVDN